MIQMTVVRHDRPVSASTVNLVLRSLISDRIEMRKWAIHNLAAILKQHKRKHPKTEVDLKEQAVAVSQEETPFCGPRPDNHWICYDSYQRPGNSSFLIKEPCYASVLNRRHVAIIWKFFGRLTWVTLGGL